MALLTYQQIGLGTLVVPVAATVTVGDSVTPDDRGWVEVTNGSGSSINVTLVVPGSQYGQERPDVVQAVAAGVTRRFGPMTADLADPTDGQIDIICSAVTTVTVAAVRV